MIIEWQLIARLAVAAVATSAVGLERSRRRQFIGMRTFGLIGVGGAAAGVLSAHMGVSDPAALSRVMQGMLAGIGFLGAGVIVHPTWGRRTTGVTTAASIWVAAIVGFAAGLGEWWLTGVSVVLSLVLLLLPEPLAADEPDDDREKGL